MNIKSSLYLLTSLIFLYSCGLENKSNAQEPAPIVVKKDTSRLQLLFAGDLMNHSPQTSAAYQVQHKSYSYDTCYHWVKDLISKADISFANLEVTLAGAPYSGYPMFSAPDAYAYAVKNAGFDYLFTSNNHTCDKGYKGVVRTIQMLDSLQLGHTGSFKDAEERARNYPSVIEKNNFKLVVLNASYGTNGMPIPAGTKVNLLDSNELKLDFEKARNLNADLIIMSVHWGYEYQRKPSVEQQKWADFFIREGAQLIIGAHPHVIQTYELRQGVPVIYSLGNFISNQRERYKDGGLLYEINLEKVDQKVRFTSQQFYPIWVQKQMSPKVVYRLIPEDFKEDSLMTSYEKQSWKTFLDDTKKHFVLTPLP